MLSRVISILNCFPHNGVLTKVTGKLLNYVQNGPVKTRYGFVIDFRKTGKFATSLRKEVIIGNYERPYFFMIKRLINPGDYVVDVGAHEGYVSLWMAKIVGGGGQVFSVEPNPENINFLNRNVRLNQAQNVEIIQKAISNQKNIANFYCQPDQGAWGSLNRFSYFDAGKKIEVETDTIDTLFGNLKRLNFMKVDTEGNELNVFMGAKEVLQNYKPIICFEVSLTFWSYFERSVDSLLNLLRDYGYQLFVLKGAYLREYTWLNERIINIFALHPCRVSNELIKRVIKY